MQKDFEDADSGGLGARRRSRDLLGAIQVRAIPGSYRCLILVHESSYLLAFRAP